MSKKTVMRMIVCSDIHCKEGVAAEPERAVKGIREAYVYADSTDYPHIDAIFTVGDFANRGTLEQMKIYKIKLELNWLRIKKSRWLLWKELKKLYCLVY